MKLKLLGLVICALSLFGIWWLYAPKKFSFKEPRSSSFLREMRPISLNRAPLKPTTLATEEPQPTAPTVVSMTDEPLSNQEIENTFSQYERQFQNCWVQRLKENPNLKGKIVFRVTISSRGKMEETQLAQSDIQDNLMLQCLNSTLKRIHFREFQGDSIEILFPLEFEF